MAPEQIRDDTRAAGPAADVHALGAILYELLTGRPPFYDPSRTVALRRTQEQDPLRPSGLTTRPVPPDLEVIALKALRKDPAERFRTAEEFADELDRWLAGMPIRSRPPSAWTRIRSTVRRYPRTSAASVAAVLALLALSFLSFALFLGERAQKRRADRTSRRVVGTLGRQSERVANDPSPMTAGKTTDRAESLTDLAQTLEFVVLENQGDGSLELGGALNGLAAIHNALGEVDRALDDSRQAERVFSHLPPAYESRLGLASSQLQTGRLLYRKGKLAEGEASTREAVEALRELVAERPDDVQARLRLARAEVNLGNYARGDRPEAAVAQYRRAIEQWEVLCHPATVQPESLEWYARTLSNLGLLMTEKGDPAGAVPILSDAVARAEHLAELVPGDKGALDNLGACRDNLGEALTAAGRPAEAIPVLNEALQAYQAQARRFPDETEGPCGMAMVQTSLAQALGQLGRWNDSPAPPRNRRDHLRGAPEADARRSRGERLHAAASGTADPCPEGGWLATMSVCHNRSESVPDVYREPEAPAEGGLATACRSGISTANGVQDRSAGASHSRSRDRHSVVGSRIPRGIPEKKPATSSRTG